MDCQQQIDELKKEHQRQLAKMQGKIDRLVEDRDSLKEDRDNLRARLTYMQHGLNHEGIINQIKHLQQDNDQLQMDINFMLRFAEEVLRDLQDSHGRLDQKAEVIIGQLNEWMKMSGRTLSMASSAIVTTINAHEEYHQSYIERIAATPDTSALPPHIKHYWSTLFNIVQTTRNLERVTLGGNLLMLMHSFEDDLRYVAREIIEECKSGVEPRLPFVQAILEKVKEAFPPKEAPGTPGTLQEGLYIFSKYQLREDRQKKKNFAEETGFSVKRITQFGQWYKFIDDMAIQEQSAWDRLPMSLKIRLSLMQAEQENLSSFFLPAENSGIG